MTSRFGNVPAWLASVVFHAVLLVILAATLRFSPAGTGDEPGRTVGIVLKQSTSDGQEYFESESDHPATESEPNNSVALPQGAFSEESPVDLAAALPDTSGLVGPGPGNPGEMLGASGMSHGAAQPTTPSGGKARTSVFGLEGEGYKFVYVFDRSASMGSGHSPLTAAKAQLLSSLEALGAQHQFLIIFYNETPFPLTLSPGNPRLEFATTQNKALAAKLIGGITATGGTDHEPALELALRTAPDVVFFLTDADLPELSARQLERIRQRNGGRTTIHCIEFGIGPSIGRENFLTKLAQQNGGKHIYVDIARLGGNE